VEIIKPAIGGCATEAEIEAEPEEDEDLGD
jgi:hypothetical protein